MERSFCFIHLEYLNQRPHEFLISWPQSGRGGVCAAAAAGSNPVTRTKQKDRSLERSFCFIHLEYLNQRPLEIKSHGRMAAVAAFAPLRPLVQIQSLGPWESSIKNSPVFVYIADF
ncbi:MAG: hypothetical protein ACI4PC_09780 [Oscillospiraceae bacterium]